MKFLVLLACLLAVGMSLSLRVQEVERLQVQFTIGQVCTEGCNELEAQSKIKGTSQICNPACTKYFEALNLTEVPTEEQVAQYFAQFLKDMYEAVTSQEGQAELTKLLSTPEMQKYLNSA